MSAADGAGFFAAARAKRPRRDLAGFFYKMHDSVRRGDRRRFLLRELPKRSVGCEIGVWNGGFSEAILSVVNPVRLILVDPWLYQPRFAYEQYGGAVAKSQTEMDSICAAVHGKFVGDARVSILRKKREDLTAQDIPDGFLDWAYVDGVHEFDFVLSDLRFACAKTKLGGIVCGDDFDDRNDYATPRALAAFLTEAPDWELLWIKRRQYFLRRKTK